MKLIDKIDWYIKLGIAIGLVALGVILLGGAAWNFISKHL